MGALSHIKVVDLSRILAGPWASQVLGDLGAQVIKIERPDGGDDTRTWGPPYLGQESAYFLSTNRNKKSVTVDFTKPEGQEIIRKLAAGADVLIENFKVGGLAKSGLDYGSLKAINPKLIYCSITGFGQTGPYAARAGYDALLQAMGGYMGITGSKDGKPLKVGVAVVDLLPPIQRRGDSGRAPKPGADRIRTAYRHGTAGCRGGLLGEPGDELSGDGPFAKTDGQRASEHRALSGFPNAGRGDDGRCGKRYAVSAILRSSGNCGISG